MYNKRMIILVMLVLALIAPKINAQWSWQNPTPTGNGLTDIHVFNSSTAIVVGAVGTVLKTTNGGTSWTSQTSGITSDLNSVHFVDAYTGWAVGRYGRILKTTDGGTNWTSLSSGTSSDMKSVYFTDSNTGWMVGLYGTIIKTTDGGTDWSYQMSLTSNHLNSVYFQNSNTGFVVGDYGTFKKTTNGGETWSTVSMGTTSNLNTINFPDVNTGWVVGADGTIKKTTDRGASWVSQTSPNPTNLFSVHFTDINTGWVTALGGYILKTTNGGTNWTSDQFGSQNYLMSINFADSNTGWVVGGNGTILKTTNGGAGWGLQAGGSVISGNINSVHFTDTSTGWAVGTGGSIIKTTNGGTNWTAQTSPSQDELLSVHFANSNLGWAVGWSGTIIKTTDGGTNWTPRASGGNTYPFYSVHFVNSNTGWAVGSFGVIEKTTDGGENWFSQTSGISNQLNSVCFVDSNTGWAVGWSGKIIKTTDGGTNWVSQNSNFVVDLQSVHFVNSNIGWAVGKWGIILNTTNGGIFWTDQQSVTGNDLLSVRFVDAYTGWVVGASGSIIKTTNGGINWTLQASGTSINLRAAHFANSFKGWAVGNSGVILNHLTVPSLTLDSPNGGENWRIGEVDSIKWTSNVSAVKLEYTTNNGTDWSTIIASTPNGSGSYPWTIPNTPSTDCRVNISQIGYPSLSDSSNNTFTISLPPLVLQYPNGGENLKIGSEEVIYWTNSSSVNVKIQYSTDAGANWTSIVDSTNAGAEEYYWTIPNTPSAQCKVRILDLNNSQIGDTSDNVFEISKYLFTITSPNGGENFRVGNENPIYWDAVEMMKNISPKDGEKIVSEPEYSYVKLELSTDNGTSWTVITESTTNDGHYPFFPPNTPSQNCKVKISQVGYPENNDVSDSVFTIYQPSLTLLRPNGNENLKVADIDSIKWTSSHLYYIKIDYSTDNGTSWNWISNASANLGSYPWVIPNTPSTQCLVKISEVLMEGYELISDTSNSVFTISQNQYSLTSPNGGETWRAGSQKNITWNSALMTKSASNIKNAKISEELEVVNIKIEFTSNNGYSWSTIADTVPNTGTFNWTVSNSPAINCKVKISQVGYPEFNDISDSVFTVYVPALAIIKPNGMENFTIGEVDTIKWLSHFVSDVKLEYSSNDGMDWNLIIASTSTFPGTYLWTIPNAPSTQCRVRVSDANDSSVYSISSNSFSISAIQFSITSPNGGENWQTGSQQNINWNSIVPTENFSEKNKHALESGAGAIEVINVKLEYSTNNGANWSVIDSSAANNGTYGWTVPYTPSTNCLVKVSQVGYPQYYDISYGTFTIFQPTITVLKPNGGENWKVSLTDTIKWTSEHTQYVKIEITTNNGTDWATISGSAPASSGSYIWTIPNTPSTNCKVRITQPYDPAIGDTSNNTFTIAPTQFTVVTPNGGENWRIGTQQSITWNSLLTEHVVKNNKDNEVSGGEPEAINVKLEYSTNDGSNWMEIIASTANSGSYNWTVPNTPSVNCRVKVSQVGFPQFSDSSNSVFTIFNPSVTVLKPNGGENWKIGETDTIKWTSGYVANIKIEATSDNGATWTVLSASAPAASGMQIVPIPNTPSAQCKVRITDASDSTVTDMSNAVFTISQFQFTLSSPNGGENWLTGSQHAITWNSSLAMKNIINQKGDESASNGGNTEAINVKLEYSTNNGSNWTEIIASTANDGSHNWTVPNTPSVNCRVKVSQVGFPQFSDSSNSVFTIYAPSVTVTTPNGGEIWRATDTDTIKWTSNDVVNVKIQYSTDNGTNWATVAISAPASAGKYVWTIPNTPSTQCKVRISSSNNSAISDMSDSLFVITPFVSAEENGSEIPTEFSLEQNYPNPFNPSTKIKFNIPNVETLRATSLQVILKVYDILGNEVATLVDEEKSAGKYEVEFNGGNLSSGIYYYTLRAGSFIETKKLILMK